MLVRFRIVLVPVLLGLLCLAGMGCGGGRSSSTEADEAPGATAADSSTSDSIAVGARPPAPGTAHVRATVASCTPDAQPTSCQLQIEEVLAYGPATSPIGGRRTVGFPSYLHDAWPPDTLVSGPSRRFVLRYVSSQLDFDPSASGMDRPEWSILSIAEAEDP